MIARCLLITAVFAAPALNSLGGPILPPKRDKDGKVFIPERKTDPYRPNVPPGQKPKRTPRKVIGRNGFLSIQVNTDGDGMNILSDAANEPSIAVDPTNPQRLVIGWRQFDSILSNFRQAGVAYSHDGGATWTFPGVVDPGQFRSDPVIVADNEGTFHYYTLSAVDSGELFSSTDGGVTWTGPVAGFGGDKEWMAVDRSGGIGEGNLYVFWNVQFSCCPPNDFTRSIDTGLSFQFPVAIPQPSMKWGTLEVGPTGELYAVGATLSQNSHVIARSITAQNPLQSPTFTFVNNINLGGVSDFSETPNPGGLLGQVYVKTDQSGGTTNGNVYVLGSVDPPGGDPLDVHFIRSEDGGQTWTSPIRVNDDPAGTNAWQWFGAMSVAPNGRIDAFWNDTRNTGSGQLSELYYAFSIDAGDTWSENLIVSSVFDSHLGWPNQNKMGDYNESVSDNTGLNIAYAATFNGEQDVYFLRIGGDCNENNTFDLQDIAAGTSPDANGNGVPDECDGFTIAAAPLAEDHFEQPCQSDGDCQSSVGADTVCTPDQETCYVPKNRLLSLDPNPVNAGVMSARRVQITEPGGPVTVGWISTQPTGAGTNSPAPHPLVDVPEYADWNGLGTVHLFGCAVAPGHTYAVQSIAIGADVGNESAYSQPLVLKTTDHWGDIIGAPIQSMPVVSAGPNGFTNLEDALGGVLAIEGMPSAPGLWFDLEGGGTEIDNVTNLADILRVVDAIETGTYPFPDPTACP